MDFEKLDERLDEQSVSESQQSKDDGHEDETSGISSSNEYVHVELINDKPQIVDGKVFDKGFLIDSIKKVLSNFKFPSPSAKNEFLMKVCTAFALPTSILNGDDNEVVNTVDKMVPDQAIDIQRDTETDVDWFEQESINDADE